MEDVLSPVDDEGNRALSTKLENQVFEVFGSKNPVLILEYLLDERIQPHLARLFGNIIGQGSLYATTYGFSFWDA